MSLIHPLNVFEPYQILVSWHHFHSTKEKKGRKQTCSALHWIMYDFIDCNPWCAQVLGVEKHLIKFD